MMTYILRTQSHGEVDSGFLSFFVGFIRIGELSMPTRHFCELNQLLASNDKIRESRILTYDLEKYAERWGEALNDLLNNMPSSSEYLIPELEEYKRGQLMQSKKNQIEVSVEDEIDMHNEGKLVPVRILDNGNKISIEKYVLKHDEFAYFAYYVVDGGFMGWKDEKYPDFAMNALRAMKGSHNRIYRSLQREGLFTHLK